MPRNGGDDIEKEITPDIVLRDTESIRDQVDFILVVPREEIQDDVH